MLPLLQVEWLKPYTDDAIRELGQGGTKNLLAVPVSFVSEHIETLEEMDMEYKELALESGIENWGRVPALNTNETFIDDLADLVIEKLPSAQPRPGYFTEALNLGPPTGVPCSACQACPGKISSRAQKATVAACECSSTREEGIVA